MLDDRIERAIRLAERTGNMTALMFVDPDHFKCINDSFGHAAGDQLLRAMAVRLSSCLLRSDTVSRNGGDEFVVLLAEGRDMHYASASAQNIVSVLTVPFAIDQQALRVTC